MNLARSRNGTMIHKRDCKYAANAKPWLWADDRDCDEIVRVCKYFGYQTCLACNPLDGNVIRPPKNFVI